MYLMISHYFILGLILFIQISILLFVIKIVKKKYEKNILISHYLVFSELISIFVLIYLTTTLYLKKIINQSSKNMISLVLCFFVLFVWSFKNIEWFPELLNLK